MKRINFFFRKWPSFYRLLQRPYYNFRYVIEAYILGTKMQEWIWKSRHMCKDGRWPKECRDTIGHPRRQILIDRISSYVPFSSILEIGCSGGPNLHLLAREYPDAHLYGIDINAKAVKEGNVYLRQQGITNVQLIVSRADELKRFGDNSMDVVFTDATLMYIGMDKIEKVIKEMRRISCKGLIFNEWHYEDNRSTYLWYDGHWVYNYKALLAKYFYPDNIVISKHPDHVWNDETWSKFGSIIEVKL